MKIIDNTLTEVQSRRPHEGNEQENVHACGQNQYRFLELSVIQILDCKIRTHDYVWKPAHIWIDKYRHMWNHVIQCTVDQMHLFGRYDLQKSK